MVGGKNWCGDGLLVVTSNSTNKWVWYNTLFTKLWHAYLFLHAGSGQVSVQEAPYPSMSISIPFTTFFSKPSKLHALDCCSYKWPNSSSQQHGFALHGDWEV